MEMRAQDKIEFISTLVDAVKDKLIKAAPTLPDEWDGIELRWLIAEEFATVNFKPPADKRQKRYQDYKHYLICNRPELA